jgi:hypothetical protein
MDLQTLVAGVGAVALLIIGLLLRRIERHLDSVQQLQLADVKQQAEAAALAQRVKDVEEESARWSDVVTQLTVLCSTLSRLTETITIRLHEASNPPHNRRSDG